MSLRQISTKSVKPRPKYGDFSIFKDGGRRHLGFLKFQIFNGRTAIKRVEVRRLAKFGRNPSNRCGDMTIFRFSQDGGEMVFTARLSYTSAVLGVVILSVCPSVRLSVCDTRA